MRVLFIDIASHLGAIACVTDDRTVAIEPIDHRIDDASLMPVMEATLKRAGWDFKDLTHIACVVGPGGFTSLRMGVTLANTFADQLKIPAAGIHMSDLYIARINQESGIMNHGTTEMHNSKFIIHHSFLWLHSTKKTQLFIRESGKEPEMISIDALKTTNYTLPTHWAGELIPEHRAIVDQLGMQPAALKPLEEILPAFLSKHSYSSDLLLPWYGRGW